MKWSATISCIFWAGCGVSVLFSGLELYDGAWGLAALNFSSVVLLVSGRKILSTLAQSEIERARISDVFE